MFASRLAQRSRQRFRNWVLSYLTNINGTLYTSALVSIALIFDQDVAMYYVHDLLANVKQPNLKLPSHLVTSYGVLYSHPLSIKYQIVSPFFSSIYQR